MKKFYMILAAVAALTMTAQAQTWETVDVGNWENPDLYNGSYFDMAPTNFYVAHTGSQMIFTPDMMLDFTGKQNVMIKGLTFMFLDETYEDIMRNVKIYIYETDATDFAINDQGVKQFFPLGEQVWEEPRLIEMIYMYGENFTLPFRFNYPYTPGKSLVVTMIFDAEDDDNCTMGSDYAPFYTSGIRGKAMTYTNNWTSFEDYAMSENFPDATATLGCGTNVDLPLTQIQFYYEDEPTEQCHAPNGAYTISGYETATVTLTNNEPGATVYYDVYFNNELVPEMSGSFTGDTYSFNVSGDGEYRIVAVAKMEGYKDSAEGGVFFTVYEDETPTGVSELVNGKQIAGVRYFNAMGQEMQQANGMTIVVTTFTDGTTSTAKVIK